MTWVHLAGVFGLPRAMAMTALAVMVVAWPTHAQAGGDTVAVDPAATAALDRMGVYLRTLKAFQVEAATALNAAFWRIGP